MKKYFIGILAFILCLGIGLTMFQVETTSKTYASVNTDILQESGATIMVSGEAETEISPDTAKISVSVENIDMNVKIAKDNTFNIFEKAQNKLSGLGISKDSINVESFSTYPSYDYNNGRKLSGYFATLNFSFKTQELEKVKIIVDELTEVGITNIQNITYSISNEEEVYNQVLVKALENAKIKAQNLLARENLTLVKVSEEHIYYSSNLMRSYSQGFENQDIIGKINIKAKIVAIYN